MRLHDAEPGAAELDLRIHARREYQELLPRARVRGVLHQPPCRRADDEPVLLRQLERDRDGSRRPEQDARQGAGPREPESGHDGPEPSAELDAEPISAGTRMAGGPGGLTLRLPEGAPGVPTPDLVQRRPRVRAVRLRI